MWEEIKRLQDAIRQITLDIADLLKRIIALEKNSSCSCECKTQPHYREASISYYYIDENGNTQNLTQEELNLNDRFPLPACADEKGILFLNDAVIFCSYHTEDGWILRSVLNKP